MDKKLLTLAYAYFFIKYYPPIIVLLLFAQIMLEVKFNKSFLERALKIFIYSISYRFAIVFP